MGAPLVFIPRPADPAERPVVGFFVIGLGAILALLLVKGLLHINFRKAALVWGCLPAGLAVAGVSRAGACDCSYRGDIATLLGEAMDKEPLHLLVRNAVRPPTL